MRSQNSLIIFDGKNYETHKTRCNIRRQPQHLLRASSIASSSVKLYNNYFFVFLKLQVCVRVMDRNEIRLQRLFLVLTGIFLLVLAGFSPKSHPPHLLDFGDNICLFM